MRMGRMLSTYGRVPVSSFVFERTFSCRTPFPYSLTNSLITASLFLTSFLLHVPSVIAHRVLVSPPGIVIVVLGVS